MKLEKDLKTKVITPATKTLIIIKIIIIIIITQLR